jgi:hypothetical protein
MSIAIHENRGSRHPGRRKLFHILNKAGHRHGGDSQPLDEDLAAAFPGGHGGKDQGRDQQWEPAAVCDLEDVGAEKSQIEQQKPPTQQRREGEDATFTAIIGPQDKNRYFREITRMSDQRIRESTPRIFGKVTARASGPAKHSRMA